MNILVVDDEKLLVKGIKFNLENEGYTVDTAGDGETAVNMAREGDYALIILDLMMPKKDGLEACQEIRGFSTVPIIMLTARSEDADKLMGFEFGADDYITKPFDTQELLARIKALLRRGAKIADNTLKIGNTLLDRDTFELIVGNDKIPLGKKEFQILEILMLNANKCVEKERLIEKIWGYDSDAEYNTVEVYVSFLRKKLSAVNSDAEIRSIRGIGYTLGVKND